MTIVYPLDLPLEFVQSLNVGEVNATSFQASPFTGRGQFQEFEGDYWTLSIGYRNLDRSRAQPVLAFRSALRGARGTFISIFPGYSVPQGLASSIPSSPSVRATVAAGSDVLPVQNAPASTEGWLLAGDIIQVGPATRPRWHRVLLDVETNASGQADIDVWPRVREGTISNDPVEYENPLGLFRMTGEVNVDIEPPVLHSLDIEAREDL